MPACYALAFFKQHTDDDDDDECIWSGVCTMRGHQGDTSTEEQSTGRWLPSGNEISG